MKKFFKEFYRATDEESGGGDADITLAELIGEDDADEPTNADPGPLTRDQIAEMMAQNNADLIASMQAAMPKPEVKKPDPIQPIVPPVNQVDPSVLAQRTIGLREQMMEEVQEDYPDLGVAELRQIRNSLTQFETYESVQQAKQDRYHMGIADAVAGRAIKNGKYVPAAFKQTQTAPAATAAPARPGSQTKLTSEDKQTIDFVNEVIGRVSPGAKLTQECFDKAAKHLARVGKKAMVAN